MAELGLTPPVLAAGILSDGTSIVAQPRINGKKPARQDFRNHLAQFAAMIGRMHGSPELQQVLPGSPTTSYRSAGLEALARLQSRWRDHRHLVPGEAEFVDRSLAFLAGQVQSFQGEGLVAAHHDICDANWLMAENGRIYLLDLDLMGLDDPAADLGPLLWWYYPPELWEQFLSSIGYAHDEGFYHRMQVRRTMHCLSILLPRPGSYDVFVPAVFSENLVDFKAALAGEGNPELGNP